jgi:protein TonB
MVTLVLEFRQHANRQQPQDDEFTKGAYRLGTPGVFAPKNVRQVVPKYTSEAMRARIQGVVVVEAVVDTDGKVDRVRIKESLDKDYGLDQAAVEAAGQWEFEPGTFEGKPAPVLITFTLEFRLHE